MFAKKLAPAASIASSVLAILCPLCIPALGALLASVGLGFALKLEVLKGLLVFFLAAALLTLGWSFKVHRDWRIFFLGFVGALLIYAGRHVWFNVLLMWSGAAMLIGASIWNLAAKSRCQKCVE
ncbi:MAG: MerC family mercury resistance protein [Candidatus Omnitrophica bacterium]|nr:MerC family mercury resistance protein [Candidatus Omnitrophota bacterium]